MINSRKHDTYRYLKSLFEAGKYDEFLKRIDKYIHFYPNDTHARFMRAKVNRAKNNIYMSINDLNYILRIEENEYAMVELYFIYYYLGMYNKAMKLLPSLYENKSIKPHSLVISELVMKKYLGYDVNFKEGSRSDYIKSQIVDYKKEAALEHIKEHIVTDDEKDENNSYFNDNVNIEYLYDLLTKSIQNNKKANKDEVLEVYYFGISNIGVYENQSCNYIKVVVVPNTNNIITFYPTISVDDNYISDLEVDYDKLFNRTNKVKIHSQIDKFNKRFKRV